MVYKKRKHRTRYNWFHIINELDLTKAFDDYKIHHNFICSQENRKPISDNRLARSFVHHFRRLLPYDLTWALKGKEQPYKPVFE